MSARPLAAASGAERENDPFVPMSRRQRMLVVFAFTVFLLLVVVASTYDPTPVSDQVPTFLALYVALLAAPFLVFRSGLGWFHPVTFVVLTSFVPLMQRFSVYAWGLDWHQVLPHRPDELSELIEFQLLLQCLGIVSFYVGFFLAPRLPVPRLRFASNPPQLIRTILLINVFSVMVFLVFVGARGGLDAHIAGWSRGRHVEFTGQHYKVALMSLGALSCWIWLAYRRGAVFSPLFWLCSVAALVIAFLSLGSRSSAIYPAFIALTIWMLRERRIVWIPIVAGLLTAMYLIGALGAYRRSGWAGRANWEAATEVGVVDTITGSAEGEISHRSTSGDASLAIFARVPDDVPLLWGSSYLGALTTPVPRAVWPGKPGQIGGLAGRVFFGQRAGAPPGAVAEAYWNFHIPGVIMVFMAFGMFMSWMGRFYRRNAGESGAIVLYASSLFLCSVPSSAAFVGWIIPLSSLLAIYLLTGILRVGSPGDTYRRPARL